MGQTINPIGNEWNPPAPAFGGGVTPPPEPVTVDIFHATLETNTNRDLVGNWIYELGSAYPGLVVDTSDGCPASPIASLSNVNKRRFYIQNEDNEAGGTSPVVASSSFFDDLDWTYSIAFKVPSVGATRMHLGGFDAASFAGQNVFGVNYYEDAPPYIEARIDDAAGAFFLFGELPTMTKDAWHTLQIRKVGQTIGLYLDDVELDARDFSGAFRETELINFAVERSENGARTGRFDEVRLFYYEP